MSSYPANDNSPSGPWTHEDKEAFLYMCRLVPDRCPRRKSRIVRAILQCVGPLRPLLVHRVAQLHANGRAWDECASR